MRKKTSENDDQMDIEEATSEVRFYMRFLQFLKNDQSLGLFAQSGRGGFGIPNLFRGKCLSPKRFLKWHSSSRRWHSPLCGRHSPSPIWKLVESGGRSFRCEIDIGDFWRASLFDRLLQNDGEFEFAG